MSSPAIFPFNFRPTSVVTITSGSYTVPSNSYAYVTADVGPGATFSINSNVVLSGQAAINSSGNVLNVGALSVGSGLNNMSVPATGASGESFITLNFNGQLNSVPNYMAYINFFTVSHSSTSSSKTFLLEGRLTTEPFSTLSSTAWDSTRTSPTIFTVSKTNTFSISGNSKVWPSDNIRGVPFPGENHKIVLRLSWGSGNYASQIAIQINFFGTLVPSSSVNSGRAGTSSTGSYWLPPGTVISTVSGRAVVTLYNV
jgi:hypothetical protein